jgi:hypothetical protein
MVRIDCDQVKCEYPSQGTWRFGTIVISSEFCSGNIGSVVQLSDSSFELSTSPDCAGTPYEISYRTWWETCSHGLYPQNNNKQKKSHFLLYRFYFSISGVKKDQMLSLCVSNLNPQTKMFNQGMKPVWRKGTAGRWERLTQDVTCSCGEGRVFQVTQAPRFARVSFCHSPSSPPPNSPLALLQIRFKFRFGASTDASSAAAEGGASKSVDESVSCSGEEGTYYFAFSYPYSFEEVVAKVDRLQATFTPRPPSIADGRLPPPDRIYFHREILTRSLEGRCAAPSARVAHASAREQCTLCTRVPCARTHGRLRACVHTNARALDRDFSRGARPRSPRVSPSPCGRRIAVSAPVIAAAASRSSPYPTTTAPPTDPSPPCRAYIPAGPRPLLRRRPRHRRRRPARAWNRAGPPRLGGRRPRRRPGLRRGATDR